jgi:hypothetical protein
MPSTCLLQLLKCTPSHHLGQHSSLSICKVLVPWLQHHPNNTVHFHHITDGMDLEDHQLMHILATSTCIEARSLHSPWYSDQTARTPRTVLGLFLAERTAEYPV